MNLRGYQADNSRGFGLIFKRDLYGDVQKPIVTKASLMGPLWGEASAEVVVYANEVS